jgi:hypothetical protein
MNTTGTVSNHRNRTCGWKQSSHNVVRSSVVLLVFWMAFILGPSRSQAFVVKPSSSSSCTPLKTKLAIHSPSRQSTTRRISAKNNEQAATHSFLSHSDIEWRLRPPEGTSRFDRWKIKVGANILRLDCKWKGEKPPQVLCPRGGRALLEAYYKGEECIYSDLGSHMLIR